jgi:hypothetical protein
MAEKSLYIENYLRSDPEDMVALNLTDSMLADVAIMLLRYGQGTAVDSR